METETEKLIMLLETIERNSGEIRSTVEFAYLSWIQRSEL